MVRGAFNKFPDFFVRVFKIVVDTWKLTMLLQYILWDNWPIFHDFRLMNSYSSNWNTHYKSLIITAGEFHKCSLYVRTLYKNDMQQNYVLNLEKMPQKRMECFRLLLEYIAWI